MGYLDAHGLNTLWAKIKTYISGYHDATKVDEAPNDNKQYARKNKSWIEVQASGGGGTWGSITGTLSNQTDLNTALIGKQKTIYQQTSTPLNPQSGDIWIDTDETSEFDNELSHETWTFTLENNTTVTKEVVIWTSQP